MQGRFGSGRERDWGFEERHIYFLAYAVLNQRSRFVALSRLFNNSQCYCSTLNKEPETIEQALGEPLNVGQRISMQFITLLELTVLNT